MRVLMKLAEEHERRLALVDEFADLLVSAMPRSMQSFTQLYTVGLVVQFRSHLKSLVPLLKNKFASEAWIVGRSMTEAIIRIKWIHRHKSYAHWAIVHTELFDRRRLAEVRMGDRGKLLRVIDERLRDFENNLPRTGSYWDKQKKRLRGLPDIKSLARQCGLLTLYRTYFFFASWYTHLSHRIIGRHLKTDQNSNFVVNLDDVDDRDVYFTSRFLLGLSITLLEILEKLGYAVHSKYRVLGNEVRAMSEPQPSWSSAGAAI